MPVDKNKKCSYNLIIDGLATKNNNPVIYGPFYSDRYSIASDIINQCNGELPDEYPDEDAANKYCYRVYIGDHTYYEAREIMHKIYDCLKNHKSYDQYVVDPYKKSNFSKLIDKCNKILKNFSDEKLIPGSPRDFYEYCRNTLKVVSEVPTNKYRYMNYRKIGKEFTSEVSKFYPDNLYWNGKKFFDVYNKAVDYMYQKIMKDYNTECQECYLGLDIECDDLNTDCITFQMGFDSGDFGKVWNTDIDAHAIGFLVHIDKYGNVNSYDLIDTCDGFDIRLD